MIELFPSSATEFPEAESDTLPVTRLRSCLDVGENAEMNFPPISSVLTSCFYLKSSTRCERCRKHFFKIGVVASNNPLAETRWLSSCP